MKIKYISDLHFEFGSKPEWMLDADQEKDILVLAGDIAVGPNKVMQALKSFQAMGYKHIIYVAGNHEYYGGTIRAFIHEMRMRLADEPNIHFLEDGLVKIDDVTFIGSTLWTNFRDNHYAEHMATDMISDFDRIRGFKPEHARLMHDQSLRFIKYAYENNPGKKVIVTHFLPAEICISPRFQGEGLLNNYFANAHDEWITTLSNTHWIFGHTHDRVDLKLGDVRLLCNPYGYFGREVNSAFDVMEYIEL